MSSLPDNLIARMRAWPAEKKRRFTWIVTLSVIIVLIALWIVIGDYHVNTSGQTTASQQIGNLITNIKNR